MVNPHTYDSFIFYESQENIETQIDDVCTIFDEKNMSLVRPACHYSTEHISVYVPHEEEETLFFSLLLP